MVQLACNRIPRSLSLACHLDAVVEFEFAGRDQDLLGSLHKTSLNKGTVDQRDPQQ
jgi:hypothetical protein